MRDNARRQGRVGLLAMAVAGVFGSPQSWATTRNWADGSSNWNTPGNWSPTGVPGAGDVADITNADAISRTVTLSAIS